MRRITDDKGKDLGFLKLETRGVEEPVNIAEKILARASGRAMVEAGEIVEARVDMAMVHDLTGPLTVKSFRKIGVKRVWDNDRIVIIFDHLVPASSVRASELQKIMRNFAREQNIWNFYDAGRGGICHQIMPEKGHVRPGELVVGTDSHTCTYGALGAFATGIGATDMAAVFATGSLWFKVPEAIKVYITGPFPSYVSPKDLILSVIGVIGADGATYKALEFTGPTVDGISMDGRLTMCNMAVEMGAKAGIVPPDEKTLDYVKQRTDEPFKPLRSDPDAEYEETVEIDVAEMEPMVACPPYVDNVKSVSEVGKVRIDQAFLGSCTNGRLEDLRVAAELLRRRRVENGVRLIVAPASQDIFLQAMREGLLETFVEAGAIVCNPNCGPCLGGHMGLLASEEACISSSNRNFIGRMGSPEAKVYLASPATVAASALTGEITDPRFMKD